MSHDSPELISSKVSRDYMQISAFYEWSLLCNAVPVDSGQGSDLRTRSQSETRYHWKIRCMGAKLHAEFIAEWPKRPPVGVAVRVGV
ncbi:hypothetical protein AVEN_104337-1 [Araneus ventricosus]|uniref:Uncharacterized protein n=1 Tax=Araneus ventricosus TaxID=182803 RepID=A0A4Y2BY80_ARAVE|nr:hypothetical protein AVEN_104337-1 [Araneus ventricosus]